MRSVLILSSVLAFSGMAVAFLSVVAPESIRSQCITEACKHGSYADGMFYGLLIVTMNLLFESIDGKLSTLIAVVSIAGGLLYNYLALTGNLGQACITDACYQGRIFVDHFAFGMTVISIAAAFYILANLQGRMEKTD